MKVFVGSRGKAWLLVALPLVAVAGIVAATSTSLKVTAVAYEPLPAARQEANYYSMDNQPVNNPAPGDTGIEASKKPKPPLVSSPATASGPATALAATPSGSSQAWAEPADTAPEPGAECSQPAASRMPGSKLPVSVLAQWLDCNKPGL